jgi:hypothetical protein
LNEGGRGPARWPGGALVASHPCPRRGEGSSTHDHVEGRRLPDALVPPGCSAGRLLAVRRTEHAVVVVVQVPRDGSSSSRACLCQAAPPASARSLCSHRHSRSLMTRRRSPGSVQLIDWCGNMP